MQIINSNINDVKYRGTGCDALYHGANLIWRRGIVVEPPIEEDNILNVTSSNGTYKFQISDSDYGTFNSDADYEVNIYDWKWVNNNSVFGDSNKTILKINKFPSVKNKEDLDRYFYDCNNLTEMPPLEVSNKCKQLNYTFAHCYNLKQIDFSKWDLTNIEGMDSTFTDCLAEEIDLSHCGYNNKVNFTSTFDTCGAKKINISNFDTSNTVIMNQIFTRSPYLVEVNLGENWDMSNVTNNTNLFSYCSSLTTIKGKITNWGLKSTSVTNLSSSPLTNESAMVLINGLAKINSRQTFTFSKQTYSTLTDEQKKIATDKGWTIASA